MTEEIFHFVFLNEFLINRKQSDLMTGPDWGNQRKINKKNNKI